MKDKKETPEETNGRINGKNTAFQSSLGLSNSELAQIGLTKREYFAVQILKGLLSNTDLMLREYESIVGFSLIYTDELLKQLDEK